MSDTSLGERVATTENAAILGAIPVAIVVGLAGAALVSGRAGYLAVLAGGVLAPGHFRQQWTDRVPTMRAAAAWGAVAAFAVGACTLAFAALLRALTLPYPDLVAFALALGVCLVASTRLRS